MSLQEDLEAYLQDYLDAPNVAKGEPAARFCHVEIPPYRLEIGVMEMFRQFFSKTDTQLFFVAPDMEIEQGLELGMDDTTTSYSYDQFLDIIQKNLLSEQGVASTIWKKSVAGGWLEDCILPPDSVIVMQIDPNMPAGCVLSLAGIVEWAVDVSSDRRSNICVFTVSPNPDCDILKKLVRHKDEDIVVDTFSLAQSQFAHQDPVRGCSVECTANVDCLAAKISEDLRLDPKIPKLVVSFQEDLWAAMKRHINNGDLDNTLEARIGLEQFETFRRTLDKAKSQGICNVVVTVIGQPAMLPVLDPRFKTMHVVLAGTSKNPPAWDNTINQVSRYPHRLSKKHRRGQLWWAKQPEDTAVTVHIPSSTNVTPAAFVAQGGSSIRFVEGYQLGGFIAAAIDFQSRVFKARSMIDAAVRYPVIVQEMKDRLAIQSLIRGGKLDLSEMETDIFRGILPVVKYDYRLAYFVALEAEPLVWRLKVQVASLLTIGCNMPVKLLPAGSSDSHLIFRECWGHGKSLAKTGSIWVTLGLVKRYIKLLEENEGRYDPKRDKLAGSIIVSDDLVIQFRKTTRQIFRILSQYESGCVASDSVAFEYQELPPAGLYQVQSNLFGAYMHQTTLCSFPVVNGWRDDSVGPIFTNLATMHRYALACPSVPTHLIRCDELIAENGTKLIIGITHTISRVQNENCLQDWTMIPERIVCEWETGKGPAGCAIALMRTGLQHEAVNDIESDQ